MCFYGQQADNCFHLDINFWDIYSIIFVYVPINFNNSNNNYVQPQWVIICYKNVKLLQETCITRNIGENNFTVLVQKNNLEIIQINSYTNKKKNKKPMWRYW